MLAKAVTIVLICMFALACQAEVHAVTGKILYISGYSKHRAPDNTEFQNVMMNGVTECGHFSHFHVYRSVFGDDYDLVVSQITAVMLTGGQIRLEVECSPDGFPSPIVVSSTPLSPS